MVLSDEELDRYARHIVLPQVGGAGQLRIKAARIAVIGAGGIGSGAIPALTGAGVGQLSIVDQDDVELSNLQRQPLFETEDVGKPKAELAARFVQSRNPNIEVHPVRARVDRENAAEILKGHDLIIDGTDNFATRLTVSDAAVELGIPLLSAAAQQFQGQVALFRAKPCYRCFVGDAFDSDDCDTCAELGVLGALPAIIGNFAGLMAIRAIVGIAPDVSGKLNLFDGLGLSWRQMRIVADPQCRACGDPSPSSS